MLVPLPYSGGTSFFVKIKNKKEKQNFINSKKEFFIFGDI